MIPAGFVFNPTEKELVFYYLRRKLRRELLPLDVLKECDIYGHKDPWELFDKTSTEPFYVFTQLKRKGSRIERKAGCGTWSNRQSNEIKDDNDSDKIVGFDRYFVFQVKDAPKTHDIETNGHWTMHEFSLLTEELDDYVLCVISNGCQKAKAKKRKLNQGKENHHNVKKMRVPMDNINDFDDKKDNGEASVAPSNLISELEAASSSDLDNLPLSTLITDQPAPTLDMEPTSMSYDNYSTACEAYLPDQSSLIMEQYWTPMMHDFDPETIYWVDGQLSMQVMLPNTNISQPCHLFMSTPTSTYLTNNSYF